MRPGLFLPAVDAFLASESRRSAVHPLRGRANESEGTSIVVSAKEVKRSRSAKVKRA